MKHLKSILFTFSLITGNLILAQQIKGFDVGTLLKSLNNSIDNVEGVTLDSSKRAKFENVNKLFSNNLTDFLTDYDSRSKRENTVYLNEIFNKREDDLEHLFGNDVYKKYRKSTKKTLKKTKRKVKTSVIKSIL
ncbi:MAG: hypothetical protein ACK5HU_04710 [Flavobacteriales bacterium]